MQQQTLFGSTPLVRLRIVGHIPSKKNNKMMVTKGPSGRPLRKPLLITKPEYQADLKSITESLRLQLLSAFQTESGATLTGSRLRSSIALSLPEDDCWTHIRKLTLQAESLLCEPGQEGCEIEIRRIN